MQHHAPRKRFGQNFLSDDHIIAKIVASISPQKKQVLIEIGPGQGALTLPLLQQIDTLTAIEIDRDLIALLQQKSDASRLNIIAQDVLKVDFRNIYTEKQQKLRIIGNLPYNISTPLLFHLLKDADIISDMHFMLQKEVVDRMSAVPGNKDYGRLTVMIQYFCEVQKLFDVPPHAFYPAPKVTSAIVRLTPHQHLPNIAHDHTRFRDMVRDAFNQRRKTLQNSLKHYFDAAVWPSDIDPKARPETLSVAQFVRLANASL